MIWNDMIWSYNAIQYNVVQCNKVYYKINFKTKDKYWKDSPVEGTITIENNSFAITEIKYNTFKKSYTKKGYNKDIGLYKGSFTTNRLINHATFRKIKDKWVINYCRLLWDLDVTYKKHPELNKSLILQSDLVIKQQYVSKSKFDESLKINIKKDLFNKQKTTSISNWNELNPIIPDLIINSYD